MIDRTELWVVILALAAGSFAFKFGFMALVGSRPLPNWLLRHLRYTAVALLPALVAPLVVWPTATDGAPDLPRFAAAVVCFAVGYFARSVLAAMFTGGAVLYGLLYIGG